MLKGTFLAADLRPRCVTAPPRAAFRTGARVRNFYYSRSRRSQRGSGSPCLPIRRGRCGARVQGAAGASGLLYSADTEVTHIYMVYICVVFSLLCTFFFLFLSSTTACVRVCGPVCPFFALRRRKRRDGGGGGGRVRRDGTRGDLRLSVFSIGRGWILQSATRVRRVIGGDGDDGGDGSDSDDDGIWTSMDRSSAARARAAVTSSPTTSLP